MQEEIATELVSALVVNTTGWRDDAVDNLISMIADRWHDERSAIEAINAVINTWTQQGRPTWAVLHRAYSDVRRRKAMEAPALTEGGTFCSVSEGRAIAAAAYAVECRRRDPETDPHIRSGFRSNEPNPDWFESVLGVKYSVGDER